MAKGCDSSWDFDYKSRVDALVDEGYTFIGRYLNHSAGVRNGLTVSEANPVCLMRAYSFVLFMSQTPARALATLPVRMELQMHGRLFLWLKTLECLQETQFIFALILM